MDLSTIFSIATGLAGTAIGASLTLLFRKMRGQTTIERNAANIEMIGKVRSRATEAFEKSEKLNSIILEGNDFAYIFLRDQKMARFDLRDEGQCQAWWNAQRYLSNPEKVYKVAQGKCSDKLEKGSDAHSLWKRIASRNRTWVHPNLITSAGKEVDAAMISQLEGLINPFEEDSSSGMCHLALKYIDEEQSQHIVIRATSDKERRILQDLLEFYNKSDVMRLEPVEIMKWIEINHGIWQNESGELNNRRVKSETVAVPQPTHFS